MPKWGFNIVSFNIYRTYPQYLSIVGGASSSLKDVSEIRGTNSKLPSGYFLSSLDILKQNFCWAYFEWHY
jgi:hypothetical protein